MKVTQSCPTLCDPMDYTVHGILHARILEWVAFPFSRGSSQSRDQTRVSHTAGRFFYQLRYQGSPVIKGAIFMSMNPRLLRWAQLPASLNSAQMLVREASLWLPEVITLSPTAACLGSQWWQPARLGSKPRSQSQLFDIIWGAERSWKPPG